MVTAITSRYAMATTYPIDNGLWFLVMRNSLAGYPKSVRIRHTPQNFRVKPHPCQLSKTLVNTTSVAMSTMNAAGHHSVRFASVAIPISCICALEEVYLPRLEKNRHFSAILACSAVKHS